MCLVCCVGLIQLKWMRGPPATKSHILNVSVSLNSTQQKFEQTKISTKTKSFDKITQAFLQNFKPHFTAYSVDGVCSLSKDLRFCFVKLLFPRSRMKFICRPIRRLEPDGQWVSRRGCHSWQLCKLPEQQISLRVIYLYFSPPSVSSSSLLIELN